MRFTITGLIAPDAAAAIDQIANPFADVLGREINALHVSSAAELLVFSPIIMADSLGTVKDDSEYRPRQAAIVIFRNINHELWMGASAQERLTLYAGALSDGLGDIKLGVLSATELSIIRAAIDRAVSEIETSPS
jgi:hypothetical protein